MMAVDAKGSSPWLQPPNSLERPLKTGWLKKQRSIVKNWQQRYFVLKGQHLHYYKEEDDLKPQVRRVLDVDAYLCCWGDGKANGRKGL